MKNGSHKDLEIDKFVVINSDSFNSVHLDKTKSGYRLCVGKNIADDITKVKNIEIIREDDNEQYR